MMIKRVVTIITGVVLLLFNLNLQALPTAKFTLKVLDEEGAPLNDARVSASFGGSWNEVSVSYTDKNGMATLSGDTQSGFPFGASTSGYYSSGMYENFIKTYGGIYGFQRWQPWNPTIEIVLKKKINPIPMYRKRVRTFFPGQDTFYGFDLTKGDWVKPHGHGEYSDFLMKIDWKYKSNGDYYRVFILKFPNEKDGIQVFYDDPKRGSELRSDHHAPANQYNNGLELIADSSTFKNYDDRIGRQDINYYFRIRSKVDETGELAYTHYGKIENPFRFSYLEEGKSIQLEFEYFLNPNNNDTNVEMDIKQNLFRNGL